MTIEQVDPQGSQSGELVPAANGVPAASSRLQQFAADGKAAYAIAQSIAKTTFVPTSYKSRGRGQNKTWLPPDEVASNITAAWLAGDEVGIKPMQALQAINLIEGTPALSAQAMRALVQAAGHEVWVEEQSQPNAGTQQVMATVAGRRKGSERIERVTWTWSRARQNDLTGKDNWQKDPLAMCIARATSAVCRLIASDVLMGLAYSIEELTDDPSVIGSPDEPPRPAASVQRRSAQAPESQEAATPPAEPPAPDPSLYTAGPVDPSPGVPTGEEKSAPENGTQDLCGEPRQDGKAFCDRPKGHQERHRYATPLPETPDEPAPAAEVPVAPDPEPELAEDGALFAGWSSDQEAPAAPAEPAAPADDDPWAEFR